MVLSYMIFFSGENLFLWGMNKVRGKGRLHEDDGGNKSRGTTTAIKQSMR